MEYPILISLLRKHAVPEEENLFRSAVDAATSARRRGSILHPVYSDAKDAINRAFDRAWQGIFAEHVEQEWDELPEDARRFWDLFGYPALHTLNGYLGRAERATLDHPLRDAVLALLREIKPLGDLFAELRPLVVKE